MIFGFGRGKKKDIPDDRDEDEEEFVLFNGAYNGNNPDLSAHGRLVQAGLIPAKKLISDALAIRGEMIRVELKGQVAAATTIVDTVPSPPIRLPGLQAQAIMQIIKLLSGLDLKTRGVPQQGSIKAEYDGKEYELRVNFIPSEGQSERMVIRALNPKIVLEKPRDLGFSEAMIEKIRGLSSKKEGIILASGPPYSGVTTLKLALMRCSDAYIYSVYVLADFGREISYAKMFATNPGDDLSKTMLRARREDADILVIDPIDKAEDAKAALEFSKECTIVADMAAKDSTEAILRLVRSTGDPQLVASQLKISASQMFVRALCKKCKRAYKPNPTLLSKIGLPPETRVLYRANVAGSAHQDDEEEGPADEGICRDCQGTGFKGKISLLEVIEMTEGMQAVVAQGGDLKAIKIQARNEKMQTYQADGLRFVVEGQTSLEELQRAFRNS